LSNGWLRNRIENIIGSLNEPMTKNRDEDVAKFTRELEEQIMAELRRTYCPAVLDHWQNPRNFRTLEDPDGQARVQGICGDTMDMFLRVKDDTIAECSFQTDGCGTTVVCGSVATELAVGKPLIEALGAVGAAEILKVLEGLPESDVHCAQLAAETLRRAMADYLYRKNEPWNKNCRKT
jgi:nitrogen fixation NifU-like protein